MVRTYKRKKVVKYSASDLTSAKLSVETGLSIRAASKAFHVPLMTLHDHIAEKHPGNVGHPTILSKEEEAYIVKSLQYAAANGWPCNRKDLSIMVAEYCSLVKRPVPWKEFPGPKFMQQFEKRWNNELSQRKPEILTMARVRNLTPEVLNSFFKLVSDIYQKYDLNKHPERIWNVDETGLATNQDAKSCFFKKGAKEAYILSNSGGKSTFTVVMCSNGSGQVLPPLIIYKAKHLYDVWCRGGPVNTGYMVSKSGWIERNIFESWFENLFIPQVKEQFKGSHIVLFLDGHGSHLSYKASLLAQQNNIILICLPPHTSHALQPLDVGVFKSMKHEWRQILRNFYRDSRLQAVDKCTFPTLLAKLWSKINVSVIISGFLGAGLFPLDRSKPSKKLLLSQIAEKDTENGTSSPFKLLRQSILKALSPEEPFQKMKVTRKRWLPNTHGRILSDDAALIQLAPQHEDNIHKIKKTNLV